MATVYPLRAWHVAPEFAVEVAALPYDVMNTQEAMAQVQGKPRSFLYVTKPEIALSVQAATDPAVRNAAGAAALKRLREEQVLRQEQAACFYAYALTAGRHQQVGVVLGASVADYESGVLRKHELTRPDKQEDRTLHMQALQAQSGKVFLLYRPHAAIAQVLAGITAGPPMVDFTAADGVSHALWRIDHPRHVQTLISAFAQNGHLYIADGHHRAAAAADVWRKNKQRPAHAVDGSILAVAFAADRVQILPYHRVLSDLHGHNEATFLAALRGSFTVQEGWQPQTASSSTHHTFGMNVHGHWYTLRKPRRALTAAATAAQMLAALDVSVLQDGLLEPILGIADPRRDKRIDFVGGIRGDAELQRRVAQGAAVAFSMQATGIDELLNIADQAQVMPPKSTWFEPKLRDGLVVCPL